MAYLLDNPTMAGTNCYGAWSMNRSLTAGWNGPSYPVVSLSNDDGGFAVEIFAHALGVIDPVEVQGYIDAEGPLYIDRVFDQSGNGLDLEQPDMSKRLVAVIQTIGGKSRLVAVSSVADVGRTGFLVREGGLGFENVADLLMVAQWTQMAGFSGGNYHRLLSLSSGGEADNASLASACVYADENTHHTFSMGKRATAPSLAGLSASAFHTFGFRFGATTHQAFVDDRVGAGSSAFAPTFSAQWLGVLVSRETDAWAKPSTGRFAELIAYAQTALTDPQREAIRLDQTDFWLNGIDPGPLNGRRTYRRGRRDARRRLYT